MFVITGLNIILQSRFETFSHMPLFYWLTFHFTSWVFFHTYPGSIIPSGVFQHPTTRLRPLSRAHLCLRVVFFEHSRLSLPLIPLFSSSAPFSDPLFISFSSCAFIIYSSVPILFMNLSIHYIFFPVLLFTLQLYFLWVSYLLLYLFFPSSFSLFYPPLWFVFCFVVLWLPYFLLFVFFIFFLHSLVFLSSNLVFFLSSIELLFFVISVFHFFITLFTFLFYLVWSPFSTLIYILFLFFIFCASPLFIVFTRFFFLSYSNTLNFTASYSHIFSFHFLAVPLCLHFPAPCGVCYSRCLTLPVSWQAIYWMPQKFLSVLTQEVYSWLESWRPLLTS